MYDYLEILDRMIQATGAKNAAKMLEFMGFSNSAASAWKRRKKIPDGSIAKVSERTGVSFQWLKTGEGAMRPSAGTIPAETNEPELVRACDVEWSAGHKPSEPLKLTQQEVMMVEFMRELDTQDRADVMDNIRELWLLKRHK